MAHIHILYVHKLYGVYLLNTNKPVKFFPFKKYEKKPAQNISCTVTLEFVSLFFFERLVISFAHQLDTSYQSALLINTYLFITIISYKSVFYSGMNVTRQNSHRSLCLARRQPSGSEPWP